MKFSLSRFAYNMAIATGTIVFLVGAAYKFVMAERMYGAVLILMIPVFLFCSAFEGGDE